MIIFYHHSHSIFLFASPSCFSSTLSLFLLYTLFFFFFFIILLFSFLSFLLNIFLLLFFPFFFVPTFYLCFFSYSLIPLVHLSPTLPSLFAFLLLLLEVFLIKCQFFLLTAKFNKRQIADKINLNSNIKTEKNNPNKIANPQT